MNETSETNWRRALLPAGSTIREAIRNLDQSHVQVVLVVSRDGLLLGTITDGDIRRGLLRGLDLGSGIDSVVHRNPFVVPSQMSHDMVLHLMQANKIRQLPVVDADRRVVGLHLWDEMAVPAARPNLIVIMAGGRGTRLRPHTENCPKPLLPVAGKPMLEHIIERAKAEGFGHFVLAIYYLGHMIEEYFGNGARWQVRIDYLREEDPLGTAGALSLLNPRPEIPFAVSNGDVLTDIRYGELLDFHTRHDAAATMAVRVHEWQHPFGVVSTRGVDIVSLEEKPISRTYVNAGIYALDPTALDALAPAGPCDMTTLFERLQADGKRTIAYAIHEPWLDVGRPDDLDHARNNSESRSDDHARRSSNP
jgi:dTDP-glucose pyrophosphorylase